MCFRWSESLGLALPNSATIIQVYLACDRKYATDVVSTYRATKRDSAVSLSLDGSDVMEADPGCCRRQPVRPPRKMDIATAAFRFRRALGDACDEMDVLKQNLAQSPIRSKNSGETVGSGRVPQ